MAWACPDRVELQSYALGKLPLPALEVLADHLLTCPECDGVVESLDGTTDEILEALLRLPSAGPMRRNPS